MNRWLDRLMAQVIRRGRLEVTWSDGAVSALRQRRAAMRRASLFRDASAEWAVLSNPELALGEAYMDGRIEFPGDSVLDFLMLLNENWEDSATSPVHRALSRLRFATRRVTQNNSLLQARRNVKHHYDLDERLYRLFLDADMQYSCAYFETPESESRRGAMGEEAASRRQARAEARARRCSISAPAGAGSACSSPNIPASTSPA